MKKVVMVAAILLLAGSSVVSAQNMGVGVMWTGSGVTPDMSLPIKLGDGSMILEPMVGFSLTSVSTPSSSSTAGANQDYSNFFEGTRIRFGLNVEKQSKADGVTPLFGACAYVSMYSPDKDLSSLDSWTDIMFGAFLGGSAPIADNLDFVGMWGPKVTLYGEQKYREGGATYYPKATEIATMAVFKIRWFVFGS